MKWPAYCLGLVGTAWAAASSLQVEKPTVVVITGDILGYLSPCGCTKPMTGGIARQATYVKKLQSQARVVLLVNGAFVSGNSKQDALKSQALAETFGALDAAAINLSPEDAKLGMGGLLSIQNLCRNKLATGSIEPIAALPIRANAFTNEFAIGCISTHPENIARPLGARPIPASRAITEILTYAKSQESAPVLLLDGDLEEAKSIAVSHPELRLIVYRSTSDSPRTELRIGPTMLVTPGQFGKSVITLTYDGSAFGQYQVVPLQPEFKDDAQVSRFLHRYLTEVDRGGFLDRLPRRPSEPFAGSETCGKCHAAALKTWKHSKHAQGLASLEAEGHGRDPDCVSCHVVGLTAVGGFSSRAKTPDLANVGCESCHGPGARHSLRPHQLRMPKIGTQACTKCHNAERSPGFDAATSWELIQHH